MTSDDSLQLYISVFSYMFPCKYDYEREGGGGEEEEKKKKKKK